MSNVVTEVETWGQVKHRFKVRFGSDAFNTLIATASVDQERTKGSTICVVVDSVGIANSLNSADYLPSLKQMWEKASGLLPKFEFVSRSMLVVQASKNSSNASENGVEDDPDEPSAAERDLAAAKAVRQAGGRITVKCCQVFVASLDKISVPDMIKGGMRRKYSRPRQVAMFLSRELTGLSHDRIGKEFNGFDSATVRYSVKVIEDQCARDAEFRQRVQSYANALKSYAKVKKFMVRREAP